MDHPAVSGLQPWRAAALVAATIATVELFLLVAVAVAFVGKPFGGEERPAAKAAAAVKQAPAARKGKRVPAARLPRAHTSVIVLNGNGVTGAAGEAASVVRGLTYIVAGTGNAPRSDYPRSLVMYRRGFAGEAHRLARDVRVKRVAPLDGLRPAELEGAHVALVLGRS